MMYSHPLPASLGRGLGRPREQAERKVLRQQGVVSVMQCEHLPPFQTAALGGVARRWVWAQWCQVSEFFPRQAENSDFYVKYSDFFKVLGMNSSVCPSFVFMNIQPPNGPVFLAIHHQFVPSTGFSKTSLGAESDLSALLCPQWSAGTRAWVSDDPWWGAWF